MLPAMLFALLRFRLLGGLDQFHFERHLLRRDGHRSSLQSQVLDGLAVGEQIIAHPGEGIEEGDRVRPAE